jgi:hypothetical protein
MKQKAIIIFGCLLAISLFSVHSYGDGERSDYKLTITNMTRGQNFTPILIATHKEGVKLFTPGSPSSQELAMLAEGGDTGPLTGILSSNPAVGHIMTTGGLLGPGETITVEIPGGRYRYLSLASMLIPTNDGFFSLNGVEAPKGHKSVMHLSPAYDAGSEENDELCEHIPGPFGCDGTGEGYSPSDGEGYVHIHAGIHGIGDIADDAFDWRNPVARIVIQKVYDQHDDDDDDDDD